MTDLVRLLLSSSFPYADDGDGLALAGLGGLLPSGRDALLQEAVVGATRISGLIRSREAK